MSLVSGSDEDDDQVLIEAFRRGDPHAFEALVRKYQHRVIGLARGLLPDWADAEDVAQEAFLRAYKGLRQFRGASQFRTWLFQIVLNTARTFRQRQRSRGEVVAGENVLEAVAGHDRMEMAVVARDRVARALAVLSAELREAVVLRDVEGLDYREIADALGVPIGTVESRIFRGRRQLREALGHEAREKSHEQ
jgi:RNA polymerase sigma-70 factor (ECF subfamily)